MSSDALDRPPTSAPVRRPPAHPRALGQRPFGGRHLRGWVLQCHHELRRQGRGAVFVV